MSTKIIIFIAWVLLTLGVISMGTSMITLPDTPANIAGVFVIVIWGVLSFKTKCLTVIINIINIINKLKKQRNEK